MKKVFLFITVIFLLSCSSTQYVGRRNQPQYPKRYSRHGYDAVTKKLAGYGTFQPISRQSRRN